MVCANCELTLDVQLIHGNATFLENFFGFFFKKFNGRFATLCFNVFIFFFALVLIFLKYTEMLSMWQLLFSVNRTP